MGSTSSKFEGKSRPIGWVEDHEKIYKKGKVVDDDEGNIQMAFSKVCQIENLVNNVIKDYWWVIGEGVMVC